MNSLSKSQRDLNKYLLSLPAGYEYNTAPFAIKEPGIGVLIIVCFVQFIVGNFILYLLEAKPFSRLGSNGQARKVEQDNSVLPVVTEFF